MIIRTSANQLFQVRTYGHGLEHVWLGREVKYSSRRGFEFKANSREILIRKAFCEIVDAAAQVGLEGVGASAPNYDDL